MSEPGLSSRKTEVSEDVFWAVYDRATSTLQERGLAHLLTGGIASAAHGYPRWSHTGEDIDLLVRPSDARSTLDALDEVGFETEQTHPDWMFKALLDGVIVDLIFRPAGGIELDEEMLSHQRVDEFKGRSLRMVGPEDLMIMLAASYEEGQPIRLKNLLGVLSHSNIDWNYLISRVGGNADRLTSFLVYADSKDIFIPRQVLTTVISSSVRRSAVEEPSDTNRASQDHDRTDTHRVP